jgi:hypothetical protein
MVCDHEFAHYERFMNEVNSGLVIALIEIHYFAPQNAVPRSLTFLGAVQSV